MDEAAKNILYHITSDEIKNKHRKVFRGKQEWPITEYWEDTSISKNLWSVTESLINDKWNS